MTSIGPTRSSDLKSRSDEIERKTQEFLKKGGKIDEADLRKTKSVDLHLRHYGKAAMEG
jgi:hypothetical protein